MSIRQFQPKFSASRVVLQRVFPTRANSSSASQTGPHHEGKHARESDIPPVIPHLARAGGRARLASGRPSSAPPPAAPPPASSPRFFSIPLVHGNPPAKSARNSAKFASDFTGLQLPRNSGSARKPIEMGGKGERYGLLACVPDAGIGDEGGRRARSRRGPSGVGDTGRGATDRAHSLMM
jgi:hypothetical protein